MTDEITNIQIFTAVKDLETDVGILKEIAGANKENLKEHIEGTKAAHQRIARLERFDSFMKGTWASIAGLAAIAGIIYTISLILY